MAVQLQVTLSSATGVIASTLTPAQASCLRNSEFKKGDEFRRRFQALGHAGLRLKGKQHSQALSNPGARLDAIPDSLKPFLDHRPRRFESVRVLCGCLAAFTPGFKL